MKNKFMLPLLFLLLPGLLIAKNNSEEYKREQFLKNGETMPYRILYPENFSEEKKYPLVLFLHGAGERGDNNEDQLMHSNDLLNRENLKEHPAIVIFPQCPKDDYWSNVEIDREGDPKFTYKIGGEPTKAMEMAMALLDSVAGLDYINREKIYVGGLSMGGMGTFELLYRKPQMFAAAFPICGGGHPETVNEYAQNTDLWIFHGAKDDVVNPKFS